MNYQRIENQNLENYSLDYRLLYQIVRIQQLSYRNTDVVYSLLRDKSEGIDELKIAKRA